MKKWRCPDCGGIHTIRPESHPYLIQYSRFIQQLSLWRKTRGQTFLPGISRQVQQHWHKALGFLALRNRNRTDLSRVLLDHLKNSFLPVSRRTIYCERWPEAQAPYLPFAVTVKRAFFSLE